MKYLILMAIFGVSTGGNLTAVKAKPDCKKLVTTSCTGCKDGYSNILCRKGTLYKSCTGPTWYTCSSGQTCRQYGSGVDCGSGSGQ